jgi:hypothetical protein
MDRRTFLESILAAMALGGISLLAGCSKKETPARQGNEEKLWKMTSVSGKVEEPLELAYARGTPAIYRDASMGKEDPSFKPQVGGG